MQSHLRCTATKITLAEGGEELLVVELKLDCPACGQHTIRIAGHHLRSIRDALIEMIDLHPTLTGKDSDVKTIKKLQFGMQGDPDPTMN